MRVAQEHDRLDGRAAQKGTQRDDVLRAFLSQQATLASFLDSLTEDWDVTEEALQETAIFVCDRWQDFIAGSNAGAWFRTVARMRCREVLQRRKRDSAASLETVDPAGLRSETTWQASTAFSARHTTALAQCMTQLPEQHQQLVDLFYVKRERCERVAAQLHKTVDSIYMMLSRIRKRLRECVQRRLQEDTP